LTEAAAKAETTAKAETAAALAEVTRVDACVCAVEARANQRA
jgi:hypothetical protein